MQIIVLANADQRREIMTNANPANVNLVFLNHPDQLKIHGHADAIIDLLFENTAARIRELKRFSAATVLINSVEFCISETDPSFVRINGWESFLSSELVEASASASNRPGAESVLSVFNKKPEWLADEPGFITPRVVSMIINEAYLAFEEKLSSRQDIDTAMKLGTNYPYGPFEWAQKIGIRRVFSLLTRLAAENPRYQPCALLQKEAGLSPA